MSQNSLLPIKQIMWHFFLNFNNFYISIFVNNKINTETLFYLNNICYFLPPSIHIVATKSPARIYVLL